MIDRRQCADGRGAQSRGAGVCIGQICMTPAAFMAVVLPWGPKLHSPGSKPAGESEILVCARNVVSIARGMSLRGVVGCDSVRLERTGARPDFCARCCSRYVPSIEWNELSFVIWGLIRDSNSRTHGLAPRRDGIHARLTRTGGRAPTRTIVRSTPRAHSALPAGQPHIDTRPHHSGRALHETPVANTHTRAHSTCDTWALHSCTGIEQHP